MGNMLDGKRTHLGFWPRALLVGNLAAVVVALIVYMAVLVGLIDDRLQGALPQIVGIDEGASRILVPLLYLVDGVFVMSVLFQKRWGVYGMVILALAGVGWNAVFSTPGQVLMDLLSLLYIGIIVTLLLPHWESFD